MNNGEIIQGTRSMDPTVRSDSQSVRGLEEQPAVYIEPR